MIKIKEIAIKANVSRGTVDRVIHNRGNVKSETREKILRIIKEENYRPNIFAKTLANNQYTSKVIGVILNSIGNPFFDEVIRGINNKFEILKDLGYELVYINKRGFNIEDQLNAIDKLLEKNISGLIITPINSYEISEKLNLLSGNKIPIININIDNENINKLLYIGPDYMKTGSTAGQIFNLISQGKEMKILIITGSNIILGHNKRIEGFCNYINKSTSHIKILDILENKDDDKISKKIIIEYFNNHKGIDGVFFCAGGIKGGIEGLKEIGELNKLKIVTVDLTNIIKKGLLNEEIIATICQEPYKQGEIAVQALFEYLIFNKIPEKKKIFTATEIIIKESL